MLILIPFIIIVFIIFAIDQIYFTDVKPVDNKKVIVKDLNKTQMKKNYIDKYLKK
ncbi:hypothetical protein [Sulfurospirillum arcachonense]|uniref:hypothetical protein n=1 Tax=Sulfurospirillum arcachonense TaxID=57666 RepID=UPI0004B9AB7A|nr:hypothetical protein [Sulfurospirillum arcachonense]